MRINTVFSLLAVIILGWSCQSKSTSDLEFLYAQPWEFNLPQMQDSLDFSNMSPTERDIAVSAITRMGGSTLTFKKDSIVVYRAYDGQETLGGWAINSDQTEMIIQMTKASGSAQRILKLSPDEIILAADRTRGYLFPKVLVPVKKDDKKK